MLKWIFAAQSGAFRPSGRCRPWKRSHQRPPQRAQVLRRDRGRARAPCGSSPAPSASAPAAARARRAPRVAPAAPVRPASAPAQRRSHAGFLLSRPNSMALASVVRMCALLAQHPRQRGIEVLVVHGVPELVQHGAHPLLVRACCCTARAPRRHGPRYMQNACWFLPGRSYRSASFIRSEMSNPTAA